MLLAAEPRQEGAGLQAKLMKQKDSRNLGPWLGKLTRRKSYLTTLGAAKALALCQVRE